MNKYVETSKTYRYKNHLNNSKVVDFSLGMKSILIMFYSQSGHGQYNFNKIARFHLNKNFEQQKYWENIKRICYCRKEFILMVTL